MVTTRIAINGYGRIGRMVLRALYESKYQENLKIVAINNRSDINIAAHLTRYDTTHGRFQYPVEVVGNQLMVNGDAIRYTQISSAEHLHWDDLAVDIVLECSGQLCHGDKAKAHLRSGAKKVLISAPADEVDATVVYGVNHQVVRPEHTIVSCASCTTNCLAPLAQVLHQTVGIEHGLITTVHAYTNDQTLIDASHKDLRRARSASTSMIPTKTGAAKAVALVLPELANKLHGYAVRVPVLNVSMVDLTLTTNRATTVAEVNQACQQAAQSPELKGIMAYCDEPLVSIDFNHHPASAIYDAGLTQVMGGQLLKVVAWYDNEWGYSNRMLDMVSVLA